jgi:UDP-glucose 4-epimerase
VGLKGREFVKKQLPRTVEPLYRHRRSGVERVKELKILITGGAGFIGSHVTTAYLNRGYEVGVVDNLSTGRIENIPAGARLFRVDIADFEGLRRVFAELRPEIVSHHAAQMDIRRSLREPLFDANVNVVGSLSVLELSAQYTVKKFIFASSGGAIYGEPQLLPATESTVEMPISHYGVTKLSVERYLYAYHHLYGLNFTALRYANVFGPRQNPHGEAGVAAIFIRQMLQGEVPTIFGDGSKTRDYVFVEDVAEANCLAVERGDCGVFNIGRGIQVSDYEIFDAIRESLGYAHEPNFAPRRLGEVEHIALDASAAANKLGWKPTIGLVEGIARTIAHIRSEVDTKMNIHRATNKVQGHSVPSRASVSQS